MAEYHERVATVTTDIIGAIKECMDKHQVTHDEYRTAWGWLTKLAESGEVPLFADVFFEADVEKATNDGKPGSPGTVEGPYHLPNPPELAEPPFVLPMREEEPGEPILFSGRVTDLDGAPLSETKVDMWQAGNDGTYAGFVGDVPKWNLRGVMPTDPNGEFQVRSILPAPYQIPNSGPTGELLELMGRHSWRPAHFHFVITAEGYEPLTTQLYFAGDPWLDGDGDVVGGVKESLVIDIGRGADRDTMARFGFDGPYRTAEYTFVLRPVR